MSNTAMEEHTRSVARIAASVRGFHDRKEPFRISHGSTNSTRNQDFRKKKAIVDTSSLTHVLQVDPTTNLAIVEPNVPMDRLVEATLKHRLVPLVVMDFPGITVGGGYSGTSGESSSFRHGFFDQTLEWIDLVLGNGEVVRCSRDQNADLFHGAAGALGTLGVVVLVAVRLQVATKYVHVKYHPVSTIEQAVEKTRSLVESCPDFIDGILFSESEGAVITGQCVDASSMPLPVQTFSKAVDPWFYLHVQEKIHKQTLPVSELVSLPEYLFRYDRGTFWMGKTIFQYFHGLLPFNKTFRRLLDDFMHTRMLYAAMHSQPLNIATIQDIAVPMPRATEFLSWCADNVQIWPLWLCPLKQSPGPTMHPHHDTTADQLMLNVGLWGISLSKTTDMLTHWEAHNKMIEAKLRDIGAMKWLYGTNMQSEAEFWSQFDRSWYDELRRKYHAESLPNVYDKVHTNPVKAKEQLMDAPNLEVLTWIWPLGMGKALFKAWKSGAYKAAKKSEWPAWK